MRLNGTALLNRVALTVCVSTALLAGCKKEQEQAATSPPTETPAAEVATVETPAAPASTAAPVAGKAFDIASIPPSDAALPAWPYVALPSGYVFDHADEMAARSKDLARVPAWTGGQLLWVEGRVFTDQVESAEGKTYSRFEVRKNVQQAVEALGGVRLSERSYDEATYTANEGEIDDFRQEFDRMQNAYWYDADADTYVIHRADKAIWIVFQSGNDQGALMVAEAPLPEAAAN